MGENWRALVLTVAVVGLVGLVAVAGPAQADPGAPAVPIPFLEGFEGATFPPAGWQVMENLGDPDCVWKSSAVTGSTNQTGATGLFADGNSDLCEGPMNAELWTPPLDLSAATSPVLTFQTYFLEDAVDSDLAVVGVSTDGGLTWPAGQEFVLYNNVTVGPSHLEQVPLTSYAGQSNVVIRFIYATSEWNWYWQIDDVKVEDLSLTYDNLVYVPLVVRAYLAR